MNCHIRFAKTCFIIACFCNPQTTLAANAKPQKITATIKVAATAIVKQHHTLWLRTGPNLKALKIQLNVRSFSTEIKYSGISTVLFFESQNVAEAETPEKPPLGKAEITAGSSTILFVPAADGDAYRLLVTRDNDFPFGSFKFLNFSQAQLGIQAGKNSEVVVVRPKAHHVFRFNQQTSFDIKIFAKFQDHDANLVRQSRFSIGPDRRELVLIFNRPNIANLQILHFVDTQ